MRHKIFNSSNDSLHIALFIIRVSFGLFYMQHGWPKLIGGIERWTGLGGSMELIGISFVPAFWGFMAAISEFGGGLLLVFGFLTRPVAFFMLFTMIIAATMHINQGDSINVIMNPLKGLVVFLALLISGAGRYSVDNSFAQKRAKTYR
jgi:putative oxidoreductase